MVHEETRYVWTKKAEERWREVIRERGYDPETAERRVAGEPAYCVFPGWKAAGYIEEVAEEVDDGGKDHL